MRNIRTYTSLTVLFSVLFLLTSGSYSETDKLKDPLISYSSSFEMSLRGLEGTFLRATKVDSPDEEVSSKLKRCYEKLTRLGVFDLDKVSMECNISDDKIRKTIELYYLESIKEKYGMKALLESGKAGSTVRTMIPEDETMLWLTLMNPVTILPIIKDSLTEAQHAEIFLNTGYHLFDEMEKYLHRESHLVIYDIFFRIWETHPTINAAFISSMKPGLDESDIEGLSEMIDDIFVNQFGAKKQVEKWHIFDKVSFSDFGCPAPVTPSYVVDRNFFIFATDMTSLNRAAEMVLTPQRTAQSVKPPVMSGMFTLNMNHIKNRIPAEFYDMFFMTYPYDDSLGESRKKLMDKEDWGIIRCEKHHEDGKIVMNCEMNRELFTVVFNVWRELKLDMFKDIIRYY